VLEDHHSAGNNARTLPFVPPPDLVGKAVFTSMEDDYTANMLPSPAPSKLSSIITNDSASTGASTPWEGTDTEKGAPSSASPHPSSIMIEDSASSDWEDVDIEDETPDSASSELLLSRSREVALTDLKDTDLVDAHPRTAPSECLLRLGGEAELTASERTCTTCQQDLPPSDFPEVVESSNCGHTIDVCTDCWQQWLEVQVGSRPFDRIECIQCNAVLGQEDIRGLASAEVYER
jgi:hypothetical protein